MPSFSQLATVLRRTHKQAATDACGGGDPTGGHSCCAHAMKDDKETKDLRDALEFNLQVDLEVCTRTLSLSLPTVPTQAIMLLPACAQRTMRL